MWQDNVDMTVWDAEPEPGLESRYTPGASDDWHAWNEWGPEAEVADFCGQLVRMLNPQVTVETGVSQGFITRRLIAANQGELYLYEADPIIRRLIPYVCEPEESPDEFMVSQADLLVLDSHWPQRVVELERWATHGKPGSYVFMHDVKRTAPQGSGHKMLANLVTQLGLPTMWFDNPRGSALLFKPEGWVAPDVVWPRFTGRRTQTGSVLVVQIDPGEVSGSYSHCMAQMLLHSGSVNHGGVVLDDIRKLGGPRVYAHRDGAVRYFLETDAEWLLQIDSDMVFPKTLLQELLAVADPDERPIVAGHCFMWRGESGPIATMWAPREGGSDADMMLFENYPRNGLVKVAATGGAVILVHRKVFETIQAADPDYPLPWYEEGFNRTSQVGEDIMFCVRARRAGFPVYVHTGLDVGHEKLMTMNEEFFADWRKARRFVVTGWPRSGTGYMSQILMRAGVACGHEDVFTPDGVEWGTRWGDSSWLAAPHLKGFGGPIIHVVRRPIDVLASITTIGFFDQSHPNAETMARFRQYAVAHTGIDLTNPVMMAVAFMRIWHEKIVAAHPHFTVKVEDVTADTLGYLTQLARVPRPSRPSVLDSYLRMVPTDWNRPEEGRHPLTWEYVESHAGGPLTEWLRHITQEQGYDL